MQWQREEIYGFQCFACDEHVHIAMTCPYKAIAVRLPRVDSVSAPSGGKGGAQASPVELVLSIVRLSGAPAPSLTCRSTLVV